MVMSETVLLSKWSALAQGLVSATSLYAVEADGRRVYRGVRPGPEFEQREQPMVVLAA